MIRIAIATAILALAACENPVTHITDPDKGETITIDRCSVDTLPNGDPVPPGYQDTTVCRRGQ